MGQLILGQTSFSKGELAPNLFGRTDLAQYHNAVAEAVNWFVDYRGGLTVRPGTEYIDSPTAAVHVLPFVIGQENSFLLVLGYHYIRVYQAGVFTGTTVTTPYAAADIPDIKYAQSADVMTLTHPSYPPATLTYAGTGVSFAYATIGAGAEQASPGTITATPPSTSNPDYCYAYVCTAVSLDGKNESLPSPPILVHYTILDETKGFVIPFKVVASASPTSIYRWYKSGPGDDRVNLGPPSTWGFIGDSQTVTFLDNNIAPDFSTQPPQFGDPFSGGQFQSITVTGGGSGYPSGGSWTGYIPLTITDSTGTGAAGYATTSHAGVVTGVFLTSSGKNYSSPTITASSGGATFSYTLSDAAPLYPAANSYFQQRAVFGGSNPKPVTVVLSEIGDYTNFNITPVSKDTDSLVIDLASLQVNTVKSFQPVAYGLLTFTTGGTFLISGGSPGAALTPASVTAQSQASEGANDLPPLQINYAVIYMQNRGSIVRDLQFAWQRQSYAGMDISTFSNHLFTGYTFSDWTFAEAPNKLIWLVRDDGVLLSCTYVPDQGSNPGEAMFAWTHHTTQGSFLSVTSVPEGNENAVYFIVQRTIAGATHTFLERLADAATSSLDAWYVDAGITVNQSPSVTVGGLSHLGGQTVSGVGDGLAYLNLTVSFAGTVTFPVPVSVATVGLPYPDCHVTDLPITTGNDPTSEGRRKQTQGVTVRVVNTQGLTVGPLGGPQTTFSGLIPQSAYSTPPPLVSDDVRSNILSTWSMRGQITITQSYPLPATILGIYKEVNIGDD